MDHSHAPTDELRRETEVALESSEGEARRRLWKLNSEIERTMVGTERRQAEGVSGERGAVALAKVHGDLVQEREEMLEELRVQEGAPPPCLVSIAS